MTEGKAYKSILFFALPIMGGILLQMLYNTVDGIVVGNFVSEQALGAVNTSGTFAALLVSISNGISNGSSVYLAQLYGAREKEQLHRAMSTMVLLMVFMGIGFTVIGELASSLILHNILSVPADTYADALIYLRIYLLGLCLMFLFNGLSASLRAIGDSKAAMLMLVVSSLVNIVLDIIFVVVLHWNVAGVAVATVIAQAIALVACMVYIRKKQPLLMLTVKELRFDLEICLIYLKTGIPMAIMNVISNVGAMAVQRLVNSYGSSFMAAVAAAGKLEQYACVPVMSFAQAVTVFTGQNVGAGKLDRVKKGLHSTWCMSTIGCGILSVVFFIAARPVIMLFGCRGEALEIGVQYIQFIPFIIIFAMFQFTTRCMLQGAGDVTVPMILTFVTLAVRVASAYIMAATPIGYRAVWYATAVDFALGSICVLIRMRTGKWKTKRLVKTNA